MVLQYAKETCRLILSNEKLAIIQLINKLPVFMQPETHHWNLSSTN